MIGFLQIFLLLLLASCQEADKAIDGKILKENQKGEYLYRLSSDKTFIPPPEAAQKPKYPWDDQTVGNIPKITKEFFRCKGSTSNPSRSEIIRGELTRYFDCGGAQKHSLPLRDDKEFIFPILINLLNELQTKTGKRVWITSGHRCPEHNTYLDSSPTNLYSKHMIGAEVSFYVQGMENEPGNVLKILFDYYKTGPKYAGKPEYQEFKRYQKPDTDVSTPPWFNKEIFIKLYTAAEGRNIDNRHPYPYISIQVRYDWDRQEKVAYSWDQAWRNYLRY